MGQLPTFRRFLSEDFQSESSWIGPLLQGLNLILNTLYSNLNNGLTLAQNCLAQIKTLSISGLKPTTTFSWNFKSNPVGVSIVQCTQTDGTPAVITSAVTCDWSYLAGVISINNVTGLNSSHTYNVTFIVWGG